jgi:hypothetical protein
VGIERPPRWPTACSGTACIAQADLRQGTRGAPLRTCHGHHLEDRSGGAADATPQHRPLHRLFETVCLQLRIELRPREAQGHVGYALTRRSWLAINATWFEGGRTRIDGIPSPDQQRNARLGAMLSIPAGASNSMKLVYSTGATTRRGSDFDTLTVQWQRVWF